MYLVLFLILSPLLLYYLGVLYIKFKYTHWKLKNVPHAKPEFPFGNINIKKSQKHLFMITQQYYNEHKGEFPYYGIYSVLRPFVVAIDLEFIRNVLIRDFNYFVNRGMIFNECDDPLSADLFSVENYQWQDLRAKLTPTFATGKLKFMFPTIVGVAKELEKCVSNEIGVGYGMELKDVLARFTTDVIVTCTFGVDCNTLAFHKSEFRGLGKKAITSSVSSRFMRIIRNNYPAFSRKLRLKTIDEMVATFFLKLVRETINFRRNSNVCRNDFMDFVTKLKRANAKGVQEGLTLKQIGAQAIVFFFAAFETSSTVMSFILLELAQHPGIQEKARQEINNVLNKYNNEMTYESMTDLKFVDQIINETMRKYPPVGNLLRIVSQTYHEPLSGVKFNKGTGIYIPIYAIHHDPEIYSNPEHFDPDRFTDEQIKKRNPCAFLPFGDGPQNCIGRRFGMMQIRVGLVTLLKNFKFSNSPNTEYPVKFSIATTVISSISELNLNVERIN